MAMPSWTHLGIGLGLTALFITLAASATGGGNVRFINFKKSTFRFTRQGGDVFEGASWGEGIAFNEIPNTPPLATYVFSLRREGETLKGTALTAAGNANIIAFLHASIPDIGVLQLYEKGAERCERPGCEQPA